MYGQKSRQTSESASAFAGRDAWCPQNAAIQLQAAFSKARDSALCSCT
jgi:hypothetical protein